MKLATGTYEACGTIVATVVEDNFVCRVCYRPEAGYLKFRAYGIHDDGSKADDGTGLTADGWSENTLGEFVTFAIGCIGKIAEKAYANARDYSFYGDNPPHVNDYDQGAEAQPFVRY